MRWVALVLVILLLPAAAGRLAPIDIPDDSGVINPGVNLFQMIDWTTVPASDPCDVGTITRGPGNSLRYTEAAMDPFSGYAATGCLEVRVPFSAPVEADHMHLRFQLNQEFATAGQRNINVEQFLEVQYTDPVQWDRRQLEPDEFEEGSKYSNGWWQDPDGTAPFRLPSGQHYAGEVLWGFYDLPADLDTGLPDELAPDPISQGTSNTLMSVNLTSEDWRDVRYPSLNVNGTMAASHIEFSFVHLPNQRIESRWVERDGDQHFETHYTVEIPPDIASTYNFSIQMEMLHDMEFVYLEFPDGTRITDSVGRQSLDWRTYRTESVHLDRLLQQDRGIQVMVPVSVTRDYGAGVYTLVVEDPARAAPLGSPTVGAGLGLMVAAVAIAWGWGGRNLWLLRQDPRAQRLHLRQLAGLWTAAAVGIAVLIGQLFFMDSARWRWSPPTAEVGLLALELGLVVAATVIILASTRRHHVRQIAHGLAQEQTAMAQADLLNVAAHELRTPLTPLLTQTFLLRSGMRGSLNNDQVESVEAIDRAAHRFHRLVEDILTANIGGSRIHLEVASLDVCELIDEIDAEVQAHARSLGIQFIKNCTRTPMQGDRDRLMQVLHNLVGNALKFTPSGGTVTVSVEPWHHGAIIRIVDTGDGMTKQQLATIGHVFRRSDDESRHPKSGAGLGLAVCRGLIQAHGGAMDLSSRGPGKGTTVRIWLPERPPTPGDEEGDENDLGSP